jgi:hypothetical protein
MVFRQWQPAEHLLCGRQWAVLLALPKPKALASRLPCPTADRRRTRLGSGNLPPLPPAKTVTIESRPHCNKLSGDRPRDCFVIGVRRYG